MFPQRVQMYNHDMGNFYDPPTAEQQRYLRSLYPHTVPTHVIPDLPPSQPQRNVHFNNYDHFQDYSSNEVAEEPNYLFNNDPSLPPRPDYTDDYLNDPHISDLERHGRSLSYQASLYRPPSRNPVLNPPRVPIRSFPTIANPSSQTTLQNFNQNFGILTPSINSQLKIGGPGGPPPTLGLGSPADSSGPIGLPLATGYGGQGFFQPVIDNNIFPTTGNGPFNRDNSSDHSPDDPLGDNNSDNNNNNNGGSPDDNRGLPNNDGGLPNTDGDRMNTGDAANVNTTPFLPTRFLPELSSVFPFFNFLVNKNGSTILMFNKVTPLRLTELRTGMVLPVFDTPDWETTNQIQLYVVSKILPVILTRISSDPKGLFPLMGTLLNCEAVFVFNSFGIQMLKFSLDENTLHLKLISPPDPSDINITAVRPSLSSAALSNTPAPISYFSVDTETNKSKINSIGCRHMFNNDERELIAFTGTSKKVDHIHCLHNALARINQQQFKELFALQPQVLKYILLFQSSEYSPKISNATLTTSVTSFHWDFMLPNYCSSITSLKEYTSVSYITTSVRKMFTIFKCFFSKVYLPPGVPQFFIFEKSFLTWIFLLESQETNSLSNMSASFVIKKFSQCYFRFNRAVLSEHLNTLTPLQASDYIYQSSKFEAIEILVIEYMLIKEKQSVVKKRELSSVSVNTLNKSRKVTLTSFPSSPSAAIVTSSPALTVPNFPKSSNYCIQHLAFLLQGKPPCHSNIACKFTHITKKPTYSTDEKQKMNLSVASIKNDNFRLSMQTSIQGLP